jgi:hypothetical protein
MDRLPPSAANYYSFPFFRMATSSQMPMIAAAKNSRIPIREMP